MNKKNGFILIISVFFSLKLTAQPHLSSRLIVTGPGDRVYSFWGHVGIAMKNHQTGEDLFYDYGNFSFHSEDFYRNFAMGLLIYAGSVQPTEFFLRNLMDDNRNVKIYPLNLKQEKLEELNSILQWSVEPENREFLYDYFLENCSTRIRDILNTVTDGALQAASRNIPSRSFRYYARVGTAPSLFMEILLHFLLGPNTDKKINLWDEMFLPESIPLVGRNLTYKGEDSIERPLLGEPDTFVISSRNPVPSKARLLWPGMLLTGLILGFVWNWAGWTITERRPLQGLKIFLRVFIILIIAIPGATLFFVSIFTNHISAHGNLNVWPTLPTVLVNLIPLFNGMNKNENKNHQRRELFMSWVWTLNLAGLVAAMLAWPFVRQDTYAFWAFFIPLLFLCSRPGLGLFTCFRNHFYPKNPFVQEGISN